MQQSARLPIHRNTLFPAWGQLKIARAGIVATQGDLNLLVGKNLVIQGADLKAAGNLTGQIGGEDGSSILTDATGATDTTSDTTTAYQTSTLAAGKGLALVAGGNASYTGTDLKSGGDMKLFAGKNLTLQSNIAKTDHKTEAQTGARQASCRLGHAARGCISAPIKC